MTVIHLYSCPGLQSGLLERKKEELLAVCPNITDLETECCHNIEVSKELTKNELSIVHWLLSDPFLNEKLSDKSSLQEGNKSLLVEIGPRLNFSTAYSSNAVSICKVIGIPSVTRIEISMRYLIRFNSKFNIDTNLKFKLIDLLHDKMTECQYVTPLQTFSHGITPASWGVVDVMAKGKTALERVNNELGLAFDSWDLKYYTDLFKNKLRRNPTTVECFDLAQSNSEHSRHWFFKGKLFLDDCEQCHSLIDMIVATQKSSNPNNVIKFSDNSSAIQGFEITRLIPEDVCQASVFKKDNHKLNIIFTAETHNFPTGVAPFSGATTGTGGRIRDVEAVGRGGNCIAGTAGYSVGNLLIPGYEQPWENNNYHYPDNLARPLKILIEASDGASDYGNKFGEPIIAGFTRATGLEDGNNERIEWVKPIMFTGGIGTMDHRHTNKVHPERGMKIVKIGGPVYRIGVGGGSASSIEVQGDNESDLDFNAVQRGDAEMENKLNRVIRSCIEDSNDNPILSIHDQGAGGNGNVLKELVEPEGAVIFTKLFTLGDETVSTMELWGAEYQESNAVLVKKESLDRIKTIAARERCPIDIVGTVTGKKNMVLSEETPDEEKYMDGSYKSSGHIHPFDLDLELVLGKMPRKEFHLKEKKVYLEKLKLNAGLTVEAALDRVLRHPSVCSKRFLTNKVDRCVTGLIAQQQCVGPLHTPIADFALTALSMYNTVGTVTSIGEQPIKGLLCPKAGARMSVAEAISNLVFAKISTLKDIKCSGNWMWAAKLEGEGAKLYRACEAMCDIMTKLGIAIDGGKDSLSMAARVGRETVKSPGTLVISAYAPCPDIRKKVTPDFKGPIRGELSVIVWLHLSSKFRLGGSILAQTFSQLGDEVPDIEDALALGHAFNITQEFILDGSILSGHDVSDGGMITTLIEMAIGGISGFQVQLPVDENECHGMLFGEEAGWLLEIKAEHAERFMSACLEKGVTVLNLGQPVGFGMKSLATVRDKHGSLVLTSTVGKLYKLWEETSYKLECRQANYRCVTEEFNGLENRTGPKYKLTFDPDYIPRQQQTFTKNPIVAIIREEGTNGDREMAISVQMAGFDVWDVTMQDLLNGTITADYFTGIVFPGGFSYADVMGSAKGWAGCLKFHNKLRDQFETFRSRSDTFSLGVCNGCQLMSLLGWVGRIYKDNAAEQGVFLDHNLSERFECRFTTVMVDDSRSIMTQGMKGSWLGIWVAHGEGRFTYRNDRILNSLERNKCISFRYIDDSGHPTEVYPMNPNGSIGGVAGICSEDGRHLAMMPHPERCTLMWQWPYVPTNMQHVKVSPWMKLFHNAYQWCLKNTN